MANPISRLWGGNEAVDIRRDCYAMATTDGLNAEITMYGVVVKKHPVDYETGEKIKGDFIALDEFMEDLEKLKNVKTITIRMNSPGGDANAAMPIHNRLRELKAKVTVIVDGIAMSAASFIMCAADTVKLSESTIIMVHKSSFIIFFAILNADEMRREADCLDAYDKALASAYVRKTGMDEATVMAMMSDETYMTGKEAFEKGFADELINTGETMNIAASADRSTLYFNGKPMSMPFPIPALPGDIPTVNPGAANTATDTTYINQPGPTGSEEGETKMTLDELRTNHPDLVSALSAEFQAAVSAEIETKVSAAAEGERSRLKEIDEVSALFNDEVVHDAKYGEKPCTAQEMAYRAAQDAAKEGKAFMGKLEADNKSSGAQNVGASPSGDDGSGAGDAGKDVKAAGKAAAQMYKETFGGKKSE